MSFEIVNKDGIICLTRIDVDGERTTMVFFDYEIDDLFDIVDTQLQSYSLEQKASEAIDIFLRFKHAIEASGDNIERV